MAEQRIKFGVTDIANLIASLDPAYYCVNEIQSDNEIIFNIVDYLIRVDSEGIMGQRFKMTIHKDRIEIFVFPTLNIRIEIANESEFQEILSLYLDFKTKVEDYLYAKLKKMIVVKSNHKNPWDMFQDLEWRVDNIPIADLEGNLRHRRAVVNH